MCSYHIAQTLNSQLSFESLWYYGSQFCTPVANRKFWFKSLHVHGIPWCKSIFGIFCISIIWYACNLLYAELFNLLAPGRPGCHFKTTVFNLVLLIGFFIPSNDNAPRRMPWDIMDDKSTLVLVMAWCRQATSHYLSQCWPSSLSPYGITRPQWVKWTLILIWILHYISLAKWHIHAIEIISGEMSFLHSQWHEFWWPFKKEPGPDFNIKTQPSWWHHQMETSVALLAICASNSPVTGEFPTKRPVTQSLYVFFHLHLNK